MCLVYFPYLGKLSRPAPRVGSMDGKFFSQWGVCCYVYFIKEICILKFNRSQLYIVSGSVAMVTTPTGNRCFTCSFTVNKPWMKTECVNNTEQISIHDDSRPCKNYCYTEERFNIRETTYFNFLLTKQVCINAFQF